MKNFYLTPAEKNVLNSVYGRQTLIGSGYNPNQLENISELNAHERKFFAKNFVSPHFFIQTLYKVKGTISTIKFNRVVHSLIQDENLRVNFCNVGSRVLKVVKPFAAVKPEIIFRNLALTDKDELDDEFRKILEADMRRDFDIQNDFLIRFGVYKTDDEEFAVIITLAQLIANNFDADKFFADLFDLPTESAQIKSDSAAQIKSDEVIREYWAKILDNPPPPSKLPFEKNILTGFYRQKAYRTKIPADILSDLRTFAQSNRTLLTAILQSAWGFMLQAVNGRRDCLFSQILPSDKDLNIIPVRFISDNNLTVEKIIRNQFRQLVISQPYSAFYLDDLTADKKLFNHFLSFAEFKDSELNYVETAGAARGKIITRNSWDAQGMKLGVYFRYSEKNLSLTFLYDEKNFALNGGALLARLYKLVLQQILVDRNAKYSEFAANLNKRISSLTDTTEIVDYKKKIRDFIYQLPILQGKFESTVDLFADNAEMITRFEGDRISGDILENKFIFVMSGKLARNADMGDGWYNPIDIIGKNSFVNPNYLLEKRRLELSAEVLSEESELLLLPRAAFIEILRKNPEISLSIMEYALAQMEKYQILWLQS